MQKMNEAIKNAVEHFSPSDMDEKGTLPADVEGMRTAAVIWSKMCLETFRGELLKKGLGVSAAVADFLAQLEEHS